MTLLDMVTQNKNTGTIPKGLPFDICSFVLWFTQPSKRLFLNPIGAFVSCMHQGILCLIYS